MNDLTAQLRGYAAARRTNAPQSVLDRYSARLTAIGETYLTTCIGYKIPEHDALAVDDGSLCPTCDARLDADLADDRAQYGVDAHTSPRAHLLTVGSWHFELTDAQLAALQRADQIVDDTKDRERAIDAIDGVIPQRRGVLGNLLDAYRADRAATLRPTYREMCDTIDDVLGLSSTPYTAHDLRRILEELSKAATRDANGTAATYMRAVGSVSSTHATELTLDSGEGHVIAQGYAERV